MAVRRYAIFLFFCATDFQSGGGYVTGALFCKKYQKFSQIGDVWPGFQAIMPKGSPQVCALKIGKNGVSSNGHNFFSMQAI